MKWKNRRKSKNFVDIRPLQSTPSLGVPKSMKGIKPDPFTGVINSHKMFSSKKARTPPANTKGIQRSLTGKKKGRLKNGR